MTTESLQPLTDYDFAGANAVDLRLAELERQRLELASRYEQILFDVSDGDDTGYALVRINAQLKKVTDEMERIRCGESSS